MDRKLLVKMYQGGYLVAATVECIPMQAGYQIAIKTHGGDVEYLTIARTNEVKHYASIKAALRDVKKIGFKEAKVMLE